MARDKIVYREVYKKGALMFKRDVFPILKHQTNGFTLCDVEVMALGAIERNGEQLEYQDVRLYLRAPKEK